MSYIFILIIKYYDHSSRVVEIEVDIVSHWNTGVYISVVIKEGKLKQCE